MGPANQSKIFDVSKPDQVTPSASSRPLIVGHHPLMPDPMVLEEREQHQTPLSQEPAVSSPSMPVSANQQFEPAPPPAPNPVPEPISLEAPQRAYKAPDDKPQANNIPPAVDNMIKPDITPSIIPSIENHPQGTHELPGQIAAQRDYTANPTTVPQNQPAFNSPTTSTANEAHVEQHRHMIWLAIIITIFLALTVAAGIYVLNARNENSNNPVQSTAILWNFR